MKKLISIIILFLLINPVIVYALDYPILDSKKIEIYDLTSNREIYEVDSNRITAIASLTKIVTTITAIETIDNLDEEVTINNEILKTVSWDASKAGLKANDKVTYRDLLYASMLPSGADATNAIAILSSGSINNFVNKMNSLAKKLKLNNTHFVNVTGLDEEGQYSTAKEIRIILEYALENDLFRQIYQTKQYTLSNGLQVKSTLFKYNGSLDITKIMGSKTGYTGNAGFCLSSLSNINSHEFLIIVLNADKKDGKYYNIVDTIDIIDFLEKHYDFQLLVEKNKIVKTIPIRLSKLDKYQIKAQNDIKYYLPDDYDKSKIEIKYEGMDHLSFLNKKGSKIGTIAYYYDNEFVTKENVILKIDPKISLIKVFMSYFYILLIPILLIIGAIVKNRLNK